MTVGSHLDSLLSMSKKTTSCLEIRVCSVSCAACTLVSVESEMGCPERVKKSFKVGYICLESYNYNFLDSSLESYEECPLNVKNIDLFIEIKPRAKFLTSRE